MIAKDLFLIYLSHEIRNPLTVIVAEMMQDSASIAPIHNKYLASLAISFGLGRLLDDVFDFTSIEQSRLEPNQRHSIIEVGSRYIKSKI